MNLTVEFPDTELAVFYALRYVASAGDPLQAKFLNLPPGSGDKQVKLDDFSFEFEESTRLVKYDTLLAGVEFAQNEGD